MPLDAPATMSPPHPVLRVQAFEAAPTVPRLSVPLMATADGELNRELLHLLTEPPADPNQLAGKRIAILATNGVEEVELTVPVQWLRERGATVHLISPRVEPGPNAYGLQMPEAARTHVLTVKFMENAGWFPIDRYLREADAGEYDALVLPGGAWNPDALRADAHAIDFVRAALEAGKPVAAICHGPLVLVSADLLRGRTVTGFWAIHPDLCQCRCQRAGRTCGGGRQPRHRPLSLRSAAVPRRIRRPTRRRPTHCHPGLTTPAIPQGDPR